MKSLTIFSGLLALAAACSGPKNPDTSTPEPSPLPPSSTESGGDAGVVSPPEGPDQPSDLPQGANGFDGDGAVRRAESRVAQGTPDAGMRVPTRDAGAPGGGDAGAPGRDAGTPTRDAGAPGGDAGAPRLPAPTPGPGSAPPTPR
jgi:hypothetical protein